MDDLHDEKEALAYSLHTFTQFPATRLTEEY